MPAISRIHQSSQVDLETRTIAAQRQRRRRAISLLLGGASLFAYTSAAMAQAGPAINVCAGPSVSLPVLTPVATVADTALGGLLDPIIGGLVGNINTSLTSALSGRPLSVSVLDTNGNLVSVPSANCSIGLPNPAGITVGGGRIDGLGGNGNPVASTGSQSAIAIGNGSSTAAGVADAVAFGTGATATATGSVALGAGSVASRLNAGSELFTNAALRSTLGVVSVGSPGNERQITNVAGGTAPTDAVNVRQLSYVGSNLATAFGGGAGFSIVTGSFTAPSYAIAGNVYRDVGSALAALAATGSVPGPQGPTGPQGPLGPTGPTGPQGPAGPGDSGLVRQATPTSPITVGAATGGTVIDVRGTDGNRTITGVAPGTVTATSTDAVNGSQLYARDQVLINNTTVLGGTWNPTTGVYTGPTYSVGGQTFTTVSGAIGALDTNGVKYDIDPATGQKSNTITLAGGDPNTPVLLRNVAPGILRTDGANVGQVRDAQAAAMTYTDQRATQTLAQANAYTDNQIAKLATNMSEGLNYVSQQVRQARTEARQAAAVGLAAASLRFDDRPGKISLAAGGGGWAGQGAAAFGVGYTSEGGIARFNLTGATSGQQWGVGGGVSLTLN